MKALKGKSAYQYEESGDYWYTKSHGNRPGFYRPKERGHPKLRNKFRNMPPFTGVGILAVHRTLPYWLLSDHLYYWNPFGFWNIHEENSDLYQP
jgi:hypothetical protein